MCIAIGCKVCRHALTIGAVGNRYVVARQDERQRRPGCVPAHQAQALQGFCALASRLPTRERQDERALDELAASKAHRLRARYSAATFLTCGLAWCVAQVFTCVGGAASTHQQLNANFRKESKRDIYTVCARERRPHLAFHRTSCMRRALLALHHLNELGAQTSYAWAHTTNDRTTLRSGK